MEYKIEGVGEHCYINSVAHTTYEHHVYLDEDIIEPAYYRKLLDSLRQAEEGSVFVFHINSFGGRVDSGLSIIRGIQTTLADTVAVLECEAQSMASAIALSCNQLICNEGSSMMIHDASFGTYGSGSNSLRQAEFLKTNIDKFFKSVYEGFLTDEEMISVFENASEVYLDADEVIERWNSKVSKLSEEENEDD